MEKESMKSNDGNLKRGSKQQFVGRWNRVCCRSAQSSKTLKDHIERIHGEFLGYGYRRLASSFAEEGPRSREINPPCATKVLIGWTISSVLNAELYMAALRSAVTQRRPAPGCIPQSDRGV
jgi:hypothetical protein